MRPAGIPALLLLALLLIADGPAALAKEPSTQQQLDTLNKKIDALKARIKESQGDRSRAARRLQQLEQEIGALAAKLRSTENKLKAQESKISALRERQAKLQAQQEQQKQHLAEQLRKAYTLKQATPMKMLLNQEDPADLTRQLTYYEYFNRARGEKIAAYRATAAELEALVPAIVAEQAQLQETRSELEAQQRDLAEQQQERQQQLAEIDRELGEGRGSLKNLAEEREALEQVLQRINEDIANIAIPANNQPFTKMRGKMPWPAPGKHLHRYGSSRQGSAVTWQGVQIDGKEGESVRAIHNGRVVFSDWLRGTGLLIILDHGGGYLSLYGHNQSLLRQEGDWVKAGESIATLGNTGGQREVGLYFEIRHKGRPVNPAQWCR